MYGRVLDTRRVAALTQGVAPFPHPCLFKAKDSCMRKLLLPLMVLAALVMVTNQAQAQDATSPKRAIGKLGVGYTHSAAPVGIRLWFMPAVAFDFGLGFATKQVAEIGGTDPNAKTTAADFAVDIGVLFAVWRKPDSQSTAYVRVGGLLDRKYAVGTDGQGAQKHSNITQTDITVMFGVEWFMTELGVPQLSLNAAAGFGIGINSPVHTAGNADNEITFATGTTGANFLASNFGFRYYFF
jgi:hypothetical protein